METFIKDIRYGIRSLLKQPGFTTVVVITLALGIGVNTAIFSLVHAVLLRPLPFADSDRLVVVKAQNAKTGETLPSVSPADFFDWKSQSQSFSNLAAYSGWSITLLEGEVSELIPATRVTDEFFSTLGVPPLLGRTFTPDEFNIESSVVILSHRLWLRRFGGDPNARAGPGHRGRRDAGTIQAPRFRRGLDSRCTGFRRDALASRSLL